MKLFFQWILEKLGLRKPKRQRRRERRPRATSKELRRARAVEFDMLLVSYQFSSMRALAAALHVSPATASRAAADAVLFGFTSPEQIREIFAEVKEFRS